MTEPGPLSLLPIAVTLVIALGARNVLAGLAAVVWSASYGYTIEKIAYKPLRKAPRLSALISAIGMSIFLQNYVLLAQTSDFLPFPGLIPDFEFMEPVAHIIGSPELVILLTTAIVMILLTIDSCIKVWSIMK